MKPGPGVSAGLLAGRAGSWSLAARPRDPRAGVRSLVGGEGVVPDTAGSRVQSVLKLALACQWAGPGRRGFWDCCWPTGGGSWVLGPLMGRAVSRGDCGLRKSLGDLSAGVCGCGPTQLVVWPEASQHLRLQAVEQRQVLALIWC